MRYEQAKGWGKEKLFYYARSAAAHALKECKQKKSKRQWTDCWKADFQTQLHKSQEHFSMFIFITLDIQFTLTYDNYTLNY